MSGDREAVGLGDGVMVKVARGVGVEVLLWCDPEVGEAVAVGVEVGGGCGVEVPVAVGDVVSVGVK